MKFGKLSSIEGLDFTLPADPPQNAEVLNKTTKPLHFYIGCTGWSMKEWVGKVYPKGSKSKDYLRHYANQFNTIELNTTHYRIPNEDTIEKWKKESSDDFRFCPKVLQQISHSRNLGIGSEQVLNFCVSIQGLEEKLGCCFIQLPPYFGADRLPVLRNFLENWPNHIPLAVEVRHESWFESPQATQSLTTLLQAYNVSTVITDVAGRRDVLHMHLSTDTAMIRFVGNGLHPSDYRRVDDWIERLNKWHQMGLKQVFFFTHEPDNILAPDLAHYLFGKLQSYQHIVVRGPKFVEDDQSGEQMSLF
jgi:uncharacterized protein YecE (DUF72 family)